MSGCKENNSNTSGQESVDLGIAGNYPILAMTAIANNSTLAITGNMGLCSTAGTFFTGFTITNVIGQATFEKVKNLIKNICDSPHDCLFYFDCNSTLEDNV